MHTVLAQAAARILHALDNIEKRLDSLEQSILSARHDEPPGSDRLLDDAAGAALRGPNSMPHSPTR